MISTWRVTGKRGKFVTFIVYAKPVTWKDELTVGPLARDSFWPPNRVAVLFLSFGNLGSGIGALKAVSSVQHLKLYLWHSVTDNAGIHISIVTAVTLYGRPVIILQIFTRQLCVVSAG